MIQFYFLSIILNLLAGFIILFENSIKDLQSTEVVILKTLNNEIFRLILSILLILLGVLKLLSPIYDDLLILGDLFPAATSILSGFLFFVNYFKNHNKLEQVSSSSFSQLVFNFSRYIGISCLVAALLHFLFPTVLFL